MTDDENDFSRNTRKQLIPAISKLQNVLGALRFSSVIYEDIITDRLQKLQLNPRFLCSDIYASDIFFDYLKQK